MEFKCMFATEPVRECPVVEELAERRREVMELREKLGIGTGLRGQALPEKTEQVKEGEV